jgi:predicted MPP superfamily phosphohydrolase
MPGAGRLPWLTMGIHTTMSRRKFVTIAALGGAAVAGGVGVAQAAPRRVKLTRHRVRLGLGRPVRVVHLTDLHIGWGTPAHLIEQTLALTRQVKPHLVVLTGDYLNHSLHRMGQLQRFIDGLPRPVVATLGNHDHWSGAEPITTALRDRGVEVLSNSHILATMRGGRLLRVVGVDDGITKHDDVRRAFSGVQQPRRSLVLTHDPRTANAIVEQGGRLVLAGHTHGGQVDIPHVTRSILKLRGHHYVSGWYKLGQGRLYVSAGIGSSVVRFRAGRRTAPEVALLELS